MRRCRWCRCRGARPSRRSSPAPGRRASSAWRAATATLLNRQKPIARAGSAWWPGGRCALKTPVDASPSSSRRPARTAPPAACSAAVQRARADDRVGIDLRRRRPRRGLDRGDVARRVHGGQRLARRPRATGRARSRAIARGERALDRHDAGGLLGMLAGFVLQRRGMLQEHRGGGHRPVPYRPGAADRDPGGRRRRRRGRSLHGALRRPSGRARDARLARRRWPSPRATGPRAGSRPRWPATTRPERHLADTVAAGRGAVRGSAARVLCDEAPAAVEDLEALGVQFDADRHGQLRAGARGRPPAPPRRARRRRRHRAAGSSASSRRSSPRIRGSTCSSAPRRAAPLTADGRAVGVAARRRRAGLRARPRSSPPAARRPCGRARPTRRAPSAAGCCSPTTPAPSSPTSSSCSSIRPRWWATNGADGFLVTEAVRGEGARLLDAAGERFVDELAPARRGRSGHRRSCCSRPAPRSVGLDMREVDPALFPNVVSALRARRHRPRARARSRRPGGALHDGRDRDRPARPDHACRACSRSANAPAPACTAPTGWPPTRSPSASCSAPARRGRRWPPARRLGRPATTRPAAAPPRAHPGHPARALGAGRARAQRRRPARRSPPIPIRSPA